MPTAAAEAVKTCMTCKLEFKPSFKFDFYPVGNDPEIGDCEGCMMKKAFASEPAKHSEPVKISELTAISLCQAGKGAKACRYVMNSGGDWCCAKASDYQAMLDSRKDSMGAQGDNCSGPPDFVPNKK